MNELKGGAPRGLPSNDRSPRGGIVRKSFTAPDGFTVRGVQFVSVIIRPRATYTATRDVVTLAQHLGLKVTPVGNPVYPEKTFTRTADGKATGGEGMLPAYHDAYRLDGPDEALGRVLSHPAVRQWSYALNVGTPFVAPGSGAFTPASEKRHREAVRVAIDYATDVRLERAQLARGMMDVETVTRAPDLEGAAWMNATRTVHAPKHDSLCPPAA